MKYVDKEVFMYREVLLLSKADECELRKPDFVYDPKEGLNYLEEDGKLRVAVLAASAPPTQSKTMAEPGDDDPDPDDDRCY
jgi:hypothetical protein